MTSWLLQDINIWLPLVKQESDAKILIQKSGGVKDFSSENNVSNTFESPLIEIKSVTLVDQHVINISNYPTSNWEIHDKITEDNIQNFWFCDNDMSQMERLKSVR